MSAAASHWDAVYGTRPTDSVSWYQPWPATSLRLLDMTSPLRGPVVDVGAGPSFLADALVERGWSDVTVLDVSAEAVEVVRQRLGDRASYIRTDLLEWEPQRRYAVWHDRAVLHFLTTPSAQQQYVAVAEAAISAGGAAVIGAFAEDGPTACSGLPTARYGPDALAALFAPSFVLEHSEREDHVTPDGVVQPFTWAVLRRSE